MKSFHLLKAAAGFTLSVASLVHADPLDPKQIPADAKWVLHVDMDSARDTKVWAAMDNQLSTNKDFQSGIRQIEQVTNAQFPRDLHDVTLYGRSADDDAGVVIIHAHVDRKQTMTLLQLNPSFASTSVGDYDLLTWDDKGKSIHGCFRDDNTMIIGRSAEVVRDALDVMDGKSESIKVDSPLAAGAKPQLLAFIAASDLATLKKQGAKPSPLASQVQSAWISLSESDGNAVIKADIQANSEDAATQLDQIVAGTKAFIAMSAQSDETKPRDKDQALTFMSVLKTLTVKREGKSLLVDWPIAIENGEKAFAVITGKKTPPAEH
jgi:hypothetical protein